MGSFESSSSKWRFNKSRITWEKRQLSLDSCHMRCVISMFSPFPLPPSIPWTHLQYPFRDSAGQFHHFINHIPLARPGQSIVKCSDSTPMQEQGEAEGEGGGLIERGREKNNYIYLFLSSLIYLNYFFALSLSVLSGCCSEHVLNWARTWPWAWYCPRLRPCPRLWYCARPLLLAAVVQFNLVSLTAGKRQGMLWVSPRATVTYPVIFLKVG